MYKHNFHLSIVSFNVCMVLCSRVRLCESAIEYMNCIIYNNETPYMHECKFMYTINSSEQL